MNYFQKQDIKKKLKTLKVDDINDLIELCRFELVRRAKEFKRYK